METDTEVNSLKMLTVTTDNNNHTDLVVAHQGNCQEHEDEKMDTSEAKDEVDTTEGTTTAAAHVPVIAKAASCPYKVLVVSTEQATAKLAGSQSATVNQPSTSALPGSKQSAAAAAVSTAGNNQCNGGGSGSSNKDRESPFSSMDEGIEDMEDIDIDNKVCQTKQYCTQDIK